MVRNTGNINSNNLNKNAGEPFENKLKNLESLAYAALSGLVISIFLIAFNLRFPAGIIIIITASLGILMVRRTITMLNLAKSSIKDVASSNEKKDDVITNFSHKIREPLNNLVIITDMLMESGLESKQKELLETFMASTNNMVNSVNELTMQSAGNLSFETRKHIRFNLLSTIQNTIELYGLKERPNIDFILNKKEFSDFDCIGDPVILKQIFLDIFNTIENTNSERSTKVTINLSREKKVDNKYIIGLRIQTDNNNPLIDERTEHSSMAARLINAEKGNFSQESGNNYSVLNITLPFVGVHPETGKQIGSTKIEELIQKEKTHKDIKDLKVLLVEDNLINQKITLLTLRPLVSSIETASNGKEALDKFGTSNYDLILMDIQMPVMSGLVAAEKIRTLETSTNTHIPIIAITANAMLGDKEKCLSAGIDDYISKPFQPWLLIEKIKKLI